MRALLKWLPAACAAISVGLSPNQPSTSAFSQFDRALLDGHYDVAEAASRAGVESARAMFGEVSLQWAASADLLVRALVLNGRGAYDDTLALARKIVQTKAAQLGPDHPSLVESQINLADVLGALLMFDQAIVAADRAVALTERHASPNSAQVAIPLDHLGRALIGARRYDQALDALERSVRIKEATLSHEDISIARTLEQLALALQRKGEYGRSRPIVQRALALQQAISPNHPDCVVTLNLQAQQLWFDGLLTESRRVSEQAVDLAELTLRPDHPTVALSLRYLASTLADLGDLNASVRLKERALAIVERGFGIHHHITGEYVHTLGVGLLNQGAYTSARSYLHRALAIFEAQYGPWHEYVATTLSVLAATDAKLGDYVSARRAQSRAATIYAHVGGSNHPFVAIALSELAKVYRDEGRLNDALPLFERALAIREKTLGQQHLDVARSMADLSSVYVLMGRVSKASELANRAIEIWQGVDAPNARELGTILAIAAQIHTDRGEYAAAKEQFAQAMQIRERVYGPSHPLYAETEAGLSVALAHLGESRSAVDMAADAERSGRKHLQLMLRSLPEREALNYAAARPKALSLVLSLLGVVPDAASQAFDELIRGRALVLDEVATRQGAGRTFDNPDDLSMRTLVDAQQRLANLLVRGPGPLSSAQYAAVVDNARRDSEAAEQALAERNLEFRTALSRAQIGLKEIDASLEAESALVSFGRYDRTVLEGSGNQPRTGQRARLTDRATLSYIAFVLRPGVPPVPVPLGPASQIDALIMEWRAGIAIGGRATQASPGQRSSRQSGAALRRLAWDPVAAHLGGATRVFIVPDGALSLLPFAALPVGSQSYLLERGPVLHYLTAERDLVPTVRASTTRGGLLAVGGPAFENRPPIASVSTQSRTDSTHKNSSFRGSDPCGGLSGVKFQPLEGTLQEVKEIEAVWRGSATSTGEKNRVLVGRRASEAAFKSESPHYRVLHVATHGFFLDNSCAPMRDVGTRGIGGLASHTTTVQNPLRLSGLALSGANLRSNAGARDEDGILTAEEVATLNLENAEWAVLSACDTGLGEIKAGEGVFGLRRAFQIAGVRTVIMSLWSVDDDATRVWMRTLYEGRLQKHLSTADAMQQASLSVLRARRAHGESTHPFYWAGFVAAGDWR
jgi:CHAT domain-containing protein